MSKAQDRKKVFALLDSGCSIATIIEQTGLAKTTVYRLANEYKSGDTVSDPEDNSEAPEENPSPEEEPEEEKPDEKMEEYLRHLEEEGVSPEEESGDPLSAPEVGGGLGKMETDALLAEHINNVIKMLSDVNNDLLQNYMRDFTKAKYAFDEAAEKLKLFDSSGLRSAVDSVNTLVDPLHQISTENRKDLPLRTAVFFIILLLSLSCGFICGYCGYASGLRSLFGFLLGGSGVLLVLMLGVAKLRQNDFFAWITVSVFASPLALFTGYFLGRMEWLTFESWLIPFLLFPVGCLAALPVVFWRRKK